MSNFTGDSGAASEAASQLQVEIATQRVHIQLLTERLTGSEARSEHASDLRMHVATVVAQAEAAKAAADTALHELRLQHTREAELLQRVVQGLQAQLSDKDKLLQSKDEIVTLLGRQLADKDKQLPVLLHAAVGDIQAEIVALRAQLAQRDATIAARDTVIAAHDAAIRTKDAEVAALTAKLSAVDAEHGKAQPAQRPGPIAGSELALDNCFPGARVVWLSWGGPKEGVVVAVERHGVMVEWSDGPRQVMGVPDRSITYK
jgi:uncharacterized coiled-coil protein SlyX